MNDQVLDYLERHVPELEGLERSGCFSYSETKDILQNRVKNEYAMNRKTPLKTDYLRSLEFEIKMEKLALLRSNSNGEKSQLQSFSRRIHLIFKRATNKLPLETRMLNRWLDYCRVTKARKRITREIIRALSLQSSSMGVWLYVFFLECREERKKTKSNEVRKLIQCGLKTCNETICFWIHYLRCELVIAVKKHGKIKISLQNVNRNQQQVTFLIEKSLNAVTNEIASIITGLAFMKIPSDSLLRVRYVKVISTFDELTSRFQLENRIYISLFLDNIDIIQTKEAMSRKFVSEKSVSCSARQIGRSLSEHRVVYKTLKKQKFS
jgi:hypothetical protein